MHLSNKADTIKKMDPRLLPMLLKERDKNQRLQADRREKGYSSAQVYELVHRSLPGAGPRMASLSEAVCPGPNGDLAVRLYRPPGAPTPAPVILFLHGGGFVVGSINTHDGIMRCLARDTGAVVVGFNYSLAPKHKFPIPLLETIALMEWIQDHASHFDLDVKDLSLAGDSAGANIALGTYLYLRDQNHPYALNVRALLFYYGYFGLKDSFTARYYGGWWDGMTHEDMERYLCCYIGDDRNNPYFNHFANDLSKNMPPTFLLACGLDPLLDDSRTLHAILSAHSCDVVLRILPDMIHACLYYYQEINEVREAIQESAAYWRSNRLQQSNAHLGAIDQM